ncbi:probable cardiolipin synthase (CMP-forming) isoform X2 [Orussus abietinus]|uniref:probable cardiolipin synthase (CMP-forming) isoform X2 n=1 Tax=Orussus abietinus TaxID=222816 RepID=UPI00062653E3|nr:probable cardiolipin synthase (CMP-forming) isoform X2 [Orussus abietinus]
MSYSLLIQFRHFQIVNKRLLQRCLSLIRLRPYSIGDGDHFQRKKIDMQDRAARGKAFKAKLIRDFKQTKEKVEEIIERENIWTVPNFLCIGRIISTPCLSYFILSQDYQVALWLLGFAGLSDFADGWIARTWSSQASKLGSFLDPVADKLLVGTLFLSLAWITLARYFDPTHATVQLAPTLVSKLNTGVQLALIASTLAAPVFHFVNHPILEGLCYLTAVTTLAGGFSYLVSKDTYKLLRKKKISP